MVSVNFHIKTFPRQYFQVHCLLHNCLNEVFQERMICYVVLSYRDDTFGDLTLKWIYLNMKYASNKDQKSIAIKVCGGEIVTDSDCVFSHDAKYLFNPSGNVVNVYNVQSGRFCGKLQGHSDRVTSVLLNERNHLQLITAGLDGMVALWDIGTDNSILRTVNIKKPILKLGQLKCYANGFVLIVEDETKGTFKAICRNLLLPDYQESEQDLCHFNYFDFRSVSFGYETNVIAGVYSDRQLFVWNADLCQSIIIPAPVLNMSFLGIATHPTDRNVIAASNNIGVIYLWAKLFSSNVNSAILPAFNLHWHASSNLRCLKFSPEGTFLFSGGEECVFVKWLWRKQQRSFLPRIGAPVSSMALSPDGSIYALGLVDNTISLISSNMTFLRSIRSIITGINIPAVRSKYSMGILFDRRHHAVVANSRPGHLQFYDVDNNQNILLLDVTSENFVSGGYKLLPVTEVIKADISVDGNWLATIQSRGDLENECTLKIWFNDAEKSSKGFTVNTVSTRAHSSAITSVKFYSKRNPNAVHNIKMVSTSSDGVFRIWRCEKQPKSVENSETTYKWVNSFSSSYHGLPIFDSDWSQDGSLFALAAGPNVLLFDGNVDGFKEENESHSDSSSMETDDWLLSALSVDPHSNVSSVKFGRMQDAQYLIGCSQENEGYVCVWNLATLEMTWKSDFLLPILTVNPFSSFVAVFSQAAMQQKTLLVFRPTNPKEGKTLNFELPARCSDALGSQLSPITSAVFVQNDTISKGFDENNEYNEVFSNSSLYFMTDCQKLYAVAPCDNSENDSQINKSEFKFCAPVISSSTGLLKSALSSILSVNMPQNEPKPKSDLSFVLPKPDDSSVIDPFFETPPHLLPAVGHICPEFLLRCCTERCGISPDFEDSIEENDDSAAAMQVDGANTSETRLTTDQNSGSYSDLKWIRDIIC